MHQQTGSQLPPRQPGGDPGRFELAREAVRWRSERVVTQEGDDLGHEMRFSIIETSEEISAAHRPVVMITSNNEKELPDAFLRRCIFYYIEFPDVPLMRRIIDVHHPNLDAKLLDQVLIKFYWLREQNELRKKPSTSELIDWINALIRSGISMDKIETHIPFIGALLKKEQDVDALQKYDTQGGRYPKNWEDLGPRYNQ